VKRHWRWFDVAEVTHVIVTNEGDYGWSAQSPQIPGFVYGRPTLTEFKKDYTKTLRDVGVAGPVLGHQQRRHETPEGAEYVIRFAEDGLREDRIAVAHRLEQIMLTDQRHDLMLNATTESGEVIFVCVVASDTLGFVIDQMDERGDVVTIAAAVADNGVYTTQLGAEVTHSHPDWTTLGELGQGRDTTISELMLEMSGRRPEQRALALA
jgi:hypothetical protein